MRPSRPPLTGALQADVCVLGASLTGWVAALELVRRGRHVVVLDTDPARDLSATSLGHVATGLGSHYLAAIERYGRDGARAVWETHRENHARLREWMAEWGGAEAFGYLPHGGFALAVDRDEAQALVESEDLLRDDGFSGEFLDHYMLEARFDVQELLGAYWATDDAAFDVGRFVATAARAAEEAGVRIVESESPIELECAASGVVARLKEGRIEAERAVLAGRGPHVPFLAERLRPVPLRALSLAADPARAIPTPASADRGQVYWRGSTAGSRLVIGASGAEADAIESFARRHFPGVYGPVLETWTWTEEVSIDGLPFIGPLPGQPLVSATGFSGLGGSLLAGRWVAEWIASGHDPTPPHCRVSRPAP